jgi:hypothetical protein
MAANAVHAPDQTDFFDAVSQLFASQVHTVSAIDVDGFWVLDRSSAAKTAPVLVHK